MGIADTAKSQGLTVEQFFQKAYDKCGYLYPDERKPDKAYEWYKIMGFIPKYVTNYRTQLRLAEAFAHIRIKYRRDGSL